MWMALGTRETEEGGGTTRKRAAYYTKVGVGGSEVGVADEAVPFRVPSVVDVLAHPKRAAVLALRGQLGRQRCVLLGGGGRRGRAGQRPLLVRRRLPLLQYGPGLSGRALGHGFGAGRQDSGTWGRA